MNFLPNDYQAPKSSSYYMKLQEGENKIRILSQPVLGWEDWHEKKPVRYRFNEKPLKPYDAKKPVKHFWAFIVWNHNEEQIQILQITQATLRKSIEALCKDADWGAPFFYDLKIIKSGEGTDTEYMVNPLPHKPVHEYIVNQFNDRPCNLEALFESADPFSPEHESYTPGIFQKSDVIQKEEPKKEAFINKEAVVELENILNECDPKYKEQLLSSLRKPPVGIQSLEQVPLSLFQRLRIAALKKRDEYQAILQGNDIFAVV